jgi:phosphoribosyl-ATP pyrophosphohydrolase/phosphoribosyl-AMP cyclohydrolase
MPGFMNEHSLRMTLIDRQVTFFSRSRAQLWTKGKTSGNFLKAVTISADCDRDTILVQALPVGPVCHTGSPTCFPEAAKSDGESLAFLSQLERVVSQRIADQTEGSYTARLHAEGPRRIAQKVGEEGFEVALAAAGGSNAEVLSESADLLYHLTLLLRERGLSLAAVVGELERRHAKSRANARS